MAGLALRLDAVAARVLMMRIDEHRRGAVAVDGLAELVVHREVDLGVELRGIDHAAGTDPRISG